MKRDIMSDLPGYEKIEGIETLYIQISQSDDFERITTKVQPPLAKRGGVAEDGCNIFTPKEEKMCAIVYHSDIEGWRKQIELGAAQLGLLTGKIVGENIELSDGRTYSLSACEVEFY